MEEGKGRRCCKVQHSPAVQAPAAFSFLAQKKHSTDVAFLSGQLQIASEKSLLEIEMISGEVFGLIRSVFQSYHI